MAVGGLLDHWEQLELKKCMRLADKDGSGSMSLNELRNCLCDMGSMGRKVIQVFLSLIHSLIDSLIYSLTYSFTQTETCTRVRECTCE